MTQYFGTDGVRGRVGESPMTVDFALRLASAAARVLAPEGGRVLIGKDTRVSGYMFEAALEAGFVAAGADVLMTGPLPTPAVASSSSVRSSIGPAKWCRASPTPAPCRAIHCTRKASPRSAAPPAPARSAPASPNGRDAGGGKTKARRSAACTLSRERRVRACSRKGFRCRLLQPEADPHPPQPA